jgi:hypothetical protein
MPVREPHTNVTVAESVTKIDVDKASGEISLDISQDQTVLQLRGIAISESNASQISIQPHGTVTATNVQDALQQLADQDFRSTSQPTGTNVQEGDTWYDTDDNLMKVYREISSGVFAWTNLVVAETNETLDAGAF